MTNDDLKYLNNIASQLNQVSEQMNQSLNNTSGIVSNLEFHSQEEVMRARETNNEINTRLFGEGNGPSEMTSRLLKIFLLLVITTSLLVYLLLKL